MARIPGFSARQATLLIASVLLASLMPAMPMMGDIAPPEASAQQTADTGAISASVTDEVGRPIAGVLVVAYTTIANYTNTTDGTGLTVVEHLPADDNGTTYLVYVVKSGYESPDLIEVVVTPWNTETVAFVINGGILRVYAEDAVGPVPDATMTILTLGYSNTTNADGWCLIFGIPIGYQYSVTATAPGYVNQTQGFTIGAGGFYWLDFLMVSLTGAISGTVTHAETEDPLYNASVSVRVGTVTVTAETDVDGFYRIPDLPSGTFTVTAAMAGFETSTTRNVVVVSGQETDGVDFQLIEKPTKLYGIVRSGTFLVPGVLITVEGAGLSTNTSIEGYYEITNITVGTYSLTASLEGYVTVTVTGVVIVRGGETQVNINMTSLPGPSLSGMVLSTSTNDVLSGVAVIVIGQEGTQRSTITNTEGLFVVPGLTKGNYTVRFYLAEYKPLELSPLVVPEEGLALGEVMMEPVPESFGGFVFGFDLAHSMMILALFLTIIILALAVMLRVRSFESPGKAPAVYDQEGEEEAPAAKDEEPRREKASRDGKRKEKKRK
ncbi:MAG: carboxypeptidase regulatory-like domain-containing protein [Thermoplasmata archaeon]